MADLLSIAASVTGLIRAGTMVTNSLMEFYASYKHQTSDLLDTTKNLEAILSLFPSLQETLSSEKFRADERSLIEKIEKFINNCNKSIRELRNECLTFDKETSQGITGAVKVAWRRAAYPLRQKTLDKLDEDIDQILHLTNCTKLSYKSPCL